jgi:hypothetical protein
MPTQISRQFIPREDNAPIEWAVPNTLAALEAELVPSESLDTDLLAVRLLPQSAIHMPLHLNVMASPEGAPVMLGAACYTYYTWSYSFPAASSSEQDLDLSSWPAPSSRPTTSISAAALERATRQDPQPRMPEVVIDDGFGV